MFGRLLEIVLLYIIGMYHIVEKLNKKEKTVQDELICNLGFSVHTDNIGNKKPLVIAMLGLVGSGKSTVAKKIAEKFPAIIINGDDIRVLLRKNNEKYEKTRAIAENVAVHFLQKGVNVIIDSDHIDQKKRASLRRKIQKAGGRLIFIRTYADIDVVSQRIREGNYPKDSFFGGAGSASRSENSGADVKFREMWRRTPHHYRWLNKNGGKWILRKLPFSIFTELDTTDNNKLKNEISDIIGKLKKI